MEPQDVERVKQIVREELGPALEHKAQEIEARMIASVTAFQATVQTNVEHHHAENRLRLQFLSEQATEAAEKAKLAAMDAAKAVAGNDYIVGMLNDQNSREEGTRNLVMDLLGEVRGLTGKSAGFAEAEAIQDKRSDKRWGIIKASFGVFGSAGAYRWLASHFHWWGGK